MVAPLVVVQGLPLGSELRSTALSACSDALKHRTCVASDEQEQGAPAPSARAVIAWPDGTDRHVRVMLDRLDMTPSRRIIRDLRFADEDPVVERWRAIGLVVAALVGESEVPSERPRESDGPDSAPSRSQGAAWLGLSALAGPGLDDGSLRLGASVHGAVALRTTPAFVLASASYALRPIDDRNLDVRWTTFAVGGGLRALVPSVDLGLRVRFELMLEYLVANGASGSAVSGGGSRLSPGVRGGGEIRWPASGDLGATLGFQVWSLPGGTAIQVDQRKLGSSQWLSYAGLIGAEWSFR